VADDQAFLVATNSYRASGGGYFPGLGPNKVVISTEDDVREIVERYLVRVGTVKEAEDRNWRLLPVKGVALQIRSGPAARVWARTPWQWVSEQADGWASYVLPAAP
jgi:2',3'-cyclic-nucleotide 2'-phosphodiesterase/3'-nucleotidase